MELRGVTRCLLAWISLVHVLHAQCGLCYSLARAYPVQLLGGCRHASVPVHQLLRVQSLDEDNDSDNDDGDYIDAPEELPRDEGLSKKQLLGLIESGQLQVVPGGDEGADESSSAEFWEQLLQDNGDDDDERSSKKKLWRKVQRIIRRQFIKVPTRYLKKLIRKLGLRRQLRSAATQHRGELEVFLREARPPIGSATNGRFDSRRVFVLEDGDECEEEKFFYY